MTVLTPEGKVVEAGGCKVCGAPAAKVRRIESAGGHWEDVCYECGSVADKGRKVLPQLGGVQ